MRFLFTILLIAIVAGIAECFGPWWVAALVAGLSCYFARMHSGKAFLAGFFGIALLWLIVALWRDIPNGHLLSQKMAMLLFKQPTPALFLMVTVLLGGIVGGLSAWAGAQLRKLA
ncbi:MAG: hypothetical protein JST06_08505 [Bacteroidetes bacterium]|nr:hypothetical protein [Bacteroidota bacterium]MBS1628423.1 hypothetical protein [Bacteroidota bacterium]